MNKLFFDKNTILNFKASLEDNQGVLLSRQAILTIFPFPKGCELWEIDRYQ